MSQRILCVDDDPNVVKAYQRQFRKHFDMDAAYGGEEALALLASRGPYAVIVADMRMPGMNGVELLATAKARAPDTVRIMLTGNNDQQTAIDAINGGHIFRFLTKPCSPNVFAQAMVAGLEQYRLVTAERELLEKTLKSSIRVLTDVLSLVNPEAFGRTTRLQRYMRELALAMGLSELWLPETVALLSQIGCVLLPEGVLQQVASGEPLTGESLELFEMHPCIAADLIAKIPRLEQIAESVKYQQKNFDGTGVPHDGLSGQDIPMGARLLKAVLDFDTWKSSGLSATHSVARMKQHANRYDPSVLVALERTMGIEAAPQTREVTALELVDGMVLVEDVKTKKGVLLVAEGQETTSSVRQFLMHFRRRGELAEPLLVSLVAHNSEKKTRSQLQ